jgi:hypothetical protein
MSLLSLILLSLLLLLVVVLSFPVFIRVESKPTVSLDWAFVKIRWRLEDGRFKTQVRVFGKKLNRRQKPSDLKKPKVKETPTPPTSRQTPKLTVSFIGEILRDTATTRILRQGWRFCRRLLGAFRIHLLKWNIGLSDFYWQGITMGLLGGLPSSERIQVRGNFNSENDFLMILRLSLWRTLGAVLLLLVRFPYYRAFRLYRRVRSF